MGTGKERMTSGASRAARDGEPSRILIFEESEKTERHRKGGEDPEYLDLDDPDLDFKLDESIRKAWAELDAFEPDMEKLNAEMDRLMKEIDEGTLEEPDFSQRGPTHPDPRFARGRAMA